MARPLIINRLRPFVGQQCHGLILNGSILVSLPSVPLCTRMYSYVQLKLFVLNCREKVELAGDGYFSRFSLNGGMVVNDLLGKSQQP